MLHSKKEGNDLELMQLDIKPDPDTILESDKNTRKHIQESQEVSPFPTGDHKAVRNIQDSMTDKHETQIAK